MFNFLRRPAQLWVRVVLRGAFILFLLMAVALPARGEKHCTTLLQPVVQQLQQTVPHEQSLQWRYFTVNQHPFAVLEFDWAAAQLEKLLGQLDIADQGALFMHLDDQLLWLFLIQDCAYSLLASPLDEQNMQIMLHVSLGLGHDSYQSMPNHPIQGLPLPLLFQYGEPDSQETLYTFAWHTTQKAEFITAWQERGVAADVMLSCMRSQYCSFPLGGARYTLNWLNLRQQSVLLLMHQPCEDCDVETR